jgi:prolyl-tRNA synthetase
VDNPMLWSKLFLPTLPANPVGEPFSRQLLQRAGYLRGADRWLFLGGRSLRKIAAIAREEFYAAGGQEMLLPDGSAFESVAREIRSYKQLPQIWYRFGADLEARAFGVEPVALDWLCRRVLERCGAPFAAAESAFAAWADDGEDEFALCAACGYAAPMELAAANASPPAAGDPEGDLSPEAFHTPGRKTIAQVAEFTGLPESAQMKSLVLVAHDAPILVMLRGDHQLSEAKFAALTGDAHFRQARSSEIFEWFGAAAGSLGPVGIRNMPIYADRALQGRRNMIAGANRDDYHLRNVTVGEDFDAAFHDLRTIAAGEACARCGAALGVRKGIELSRLPAPRLARDLHITNAQAAEAPVWMSAGRVGIERILIAAAEAGFDKDGLILPPAISPFDVIVTPANIGDAPQRETAETIYRECLTLGLDALLDDRDERPGVKFKDADLIGVPFRITVGKKLAEGLVEVVERKTRQVRDTAVAEAATAVKLTYWA